MMFRVRFFFLLLIVVGAAPATAQRAARGSAAAADATSVRTELAAVLLQSRRYAEAAREYRIVLSREPRNYDARLGLARALAWGEQHRAAEYELRMLRGMRPSDREVDELLLSVRASMEPTSAEAGGWVAERPDFIPYRRALARALVREERFAAAIPHYDWLLTRDRTRPFTLEAAHVYTSARQYDKAMQQLRELLAGAVGDTAVRHLLASTRAQARQFDEALATYDTLIAWYPESGLLLERGQLHLARGKFAAAEADALASLRARPTVDAYLLLGDLRRWRGAYAEARQSYEYARTLAFDDPAVIAAHAQLRREERPIIAVVGNRDLSPGWQIRSTSLSDNEGINYATLGARRQIELGHGIIGSADVEVRRLGGDQMQGVDVGRTGFAFTGGIMREASYGAFLGRLHGHAGVVQHIDATTFAGAIGADAWYGPWGAAIEVVRAPAYPALLTAGSIRPAGEDNGLLRETTVQFALGGPLGDVDAALSVQRSDITDGNHRTAVQAVARYPLTPSLAAIYAGSGIWFEERSALYWDPASYVASSAGLEVFRRRPRGLSYAARVLGGAARSEEEVIVNRRASNETHTALQLSGGGELTWRNSFRELGAAVTYGTSRAGEYRRFEAGLFVRLLH